MKELLKAYAIRAHEASRACDNYACAAGRRLSSKLSPEVG